MKVVGSVYEDMGIFQWNDVFFFTNTLVNLSLATPDQAYNVQIWCLNDRY